MLIAEPLFRAQITHTLLMYKCLIHLQNTYDMSVICLSHIQQEVENALEGLCNLLPSSISSEVGVPNTVTDRVVSSVQYCYI